MRLVAGCFAVMFISWSVPCAAMTDDGAASRFEAVKQSPTQLREFLYRMPKGGDLHSHLGGAVYAEARIRAGAAAGVCVNTETLAVAPCGPATRKLADALRDKTLKLALIDAWSMIHHHFRPGAFNGSADFGEMAADVVERSGRQHMRYLELMVTFQEVAVPSLARSLPWTGDMGSYSSA
jgi:adenosine deaminase